MQSYKLVALMAGEGSRLWLRIPDSHIMVKWREASVVYGPGVQDPLTLMRLYLSSNTNVCMLAQGSY